MGFSKKINTRTKVIHGFGSFSSGIKESAFGVFLIFFYTQVIGLSGSLAGTVMLCALLVDAISDPLVGHWSDRFHSRWGRRHPFMYISTIPVALSFYCLFNPPLDASTTLTFLWMLVFAVLVRLSITFYVIPSSSMIAEMSSDYHERTALTSFRVLFGWLGVISMSYLAYTWLFAPSEEFDDGRFDATAYQLYGLIGAGGIALSIFVASIGTHHLIPSLNEGSKEGFSLLTFFKEIGFLLRNKIFLCLFMTLLVASVSSGVIDVFSLYINTYFWGFSSKEISILLFGSMIGVVLAFIGLKLYAPKFDKKNLFMFFIVVAILSGPMPIVFRLLEVLPDNGTQFVFNLIFVSTVFSAVAGVGAIVLSGSMVADIIDMNFLETGRRQEGLHFSTFALSSKATTGIGGFVAGLTLDLIDFPSGDVALKVSKETLFSLGFSSAMLVTFCLVLALFLLSKYSLTKKVHDRIRSEIAGARADDRQTKLLDRRSDSVGSAGQGALVD